MLTGGTRYGFGGGGKISIAQEMDLGVVKKISSVDTRDGFGGGELISIAQEVDLGVVCVTL